ncbi:MAG: tetratricopeptide repeat protein [Alphaproteobacteria bacterium]|nr:tetratricopeptide repeat protein [Alphaproteobacteria bacterium]
MPPSQLLADPALEAYRTGRFAEAVDGLRRLAERHRDDVLVQRYLGLAYYGQKRFSEAAAALEAAIAMEPDNATTWLYLGLARYALARYAAAEEAFRKAEAIEPDARSAAVARSYREAMRRYMAERTLPPPTQPKRWSLTVQGGIAYDDNVPLAARSTPGPKGSWRTFQSAWGGYDVIQSDGWRLRADGFAYLGQNLRQSLDGYDQMTVEAALDLSYQTSVLGMPARPGLRYAFQPTWQGGSRYDDSHAVTASLVVQPLDDTISYLFYRYGTEDYRSEGLQPQFTSQDQAGHQVGLTQYYYFDDRKHYVYAGYAYLQNNAKGSFYDDRGHRLAVGGGFQLPWELRLLVRAEYQWRDYPNYPIQPRRNFERQRYSATLTRPIADGLAVSLGYDFIDEDSNYSVLSYRRSLVTLSLIYDF